MNTINPKNKEHKKGYAYISNAFMLWVGIFIFFLMFLHLYFTSKYPQTDIISNEIMLGITIVLVGYVWIQALRDRHRLISLNRDLLDAKEQLEREEIETIAALILTEEAKDPYVQGHSKRVAKYAVAMAKEMGFSKERKRVIERAAILHDLGKLGIVDEILKKIGGLNDKEWEIMKKHTKRGVEILRPLRFLESEKNIISHHHERYDGGGYPDSLKGENIPLESRILAVCDTFDAMNSKRPYREELPTNAIIVELKKVAGTQLDPSIVDIFLKMIEKNPDFWELD